jgi:hypothetical protein
MSRLTPFARLLITVGIVLGLFFGVKKFFPDITDKLGKGTTTESSNMPSAPTGDNSTLPKSSDNSNTPSNSANNSTTAPANRPVFDFKPKEPVNGKLKGVVELGASGFNSFIVRIDQQKNWKLEKADFGSSLVYEKLTSDEDVKSGLKNYISNMLSFGVSPREIHFVISSGAQKVELTGKIITFLKNMGYVVNAVTADQEGKLGLKCALPKDYEDDAFLCDIGSGNTKIAWLEGGQIKTIETHGAKYFQNNTADDAVYSEVKRLSDRVPSARRKTCFIIGGVPFSLAKQVRTGKERYTVLNAPEKYKDGGDAKTKAGLNIYKAVSDGTDCLQFVFDWDANFTIGFLLGLP